MIPMSLTEMTMQMTNVMGTSSGLSSVDKAKALIQFAEGTTAQVLMRAGFTRPEWEGDSWTADWDAWNANRLTTAVNNSMENAPGDSLLDVDMLQMYDVSALLDSLPDQAPLSHIVVFCADRVVEWDEKRNRVRRAMTYEEAARQMLYWFMIKILQIMRKNERDRVAQLPDLFDRLGAFWDDSPLPDKAEIVIAIRHQIEFTNPEGMASLVSGGGPIKLGAYAYSFRNFLKRGDKPIQCREMASWATVIGLDIGLQAALHLLANQHLIPESYQGEHWLFFAGTRANWVDGKSVLACLRWDGNAWYLDWYPVESPFYPQHLVVDLRTAA